MDKQKLRQIFKNQLRTQKNPSHRLSQKIVSNLQVFLSWSEYAVVASYFPLGGEPDLRDFQVPHPRTRFVYPRTKGGGSNVWEFAPSLKGKRQRAHWGGYEPLSSEPTCPLDSVDVFLIPGLAFDKYGGRLGRGGGVYDKILSQRRSSGLRIGLCFSSQVFKERLPLSLHDQKMDALVTDRKLYVFSPTVFQLRKKREVLRHA